MPMRREDYPHDWYTISFEIRAYRAKWKCEGSPAYPDCRARNGEPHPVTGSKVFLTTAHLDHDTMNGDPKNLRAMCQRCHLTYDAKYHAMNAAITRRQRQVDSGQLEMPVD